VPIIGTAGHVDHGKSTLVTALTGRDPDRWAEEKARGLTIDLGFAWTDLGDGTDVGFVDVPGHERFIKNMLAGVGALDVALLVVAADEGWMPQTEEHVAVLDLLEVHHGVIAVTRTDLVDADTLELAQLEIQEEVAGTTLEEWPLIPVSAPHGLGLTDLTYALGAQLDAAGASPDLGRPRLWIDRAFTISGAGAVVTGTLVGGAVSTGDELEMWPGSRRVRVRGIQSHEAELGSIAPGNRTAFNLTGVDHGDVERGTCLAAPGSLRASRKLLVSLRPVRELGEPLSDRGAYQLHVGSGAWPVRLRILLEVQPDLPGAALVSLDRDLAVEAGDRFIIRDVGRRAVVGGGRILDPHPAGKLSTIRDTVGHLRSPVADSPDGRAQAMLEVRRRAALADLAADSGGGAPTAGFFTDTAAISLDAGAALHEEICRRVIGYQQDNPLRPGAPRGELMTALDLSTEMLGVLLSGHGLLLDEGATIRTADFSGGWGSREQGAIDAATESLRTAGLAAPRASQLGLERELLHAAIRSGEVVRVADDLVYLPEQIDEIIARIQDLDDFTVAQFRDELGVSRRHAVPLLEWLDAEGWTVRRGDIRSVRRQHPPPESDAPPQ
jgi:selenocysteine-specific elongation factor